MSHTRMIVVRVSRLRCRHAIVCADGPLQLWFTQAEINRVAGSIRKSRWTVPPGAYHLSYDSYNWRSFLLLGASAEPSGRSLLVSIGPSIILISTTELKWVDRLRIHVSNLLCLAVWLCGCVFKPILKYCAYSHTCTNESDLVLSCVLNMSRRWNSLDTDMRSLLRWLGWKSKIKTWRY